MAKLPDDDKEALRDRGFVHRRGLVSSAKVAAALRKINHELGNGLSAEDAAALKVNAKSFGSDALLKSVELVGLLRDSPVWDLVTDLYGASNIFLPPYYVQVALRFPESINTPQYLPWHLDNITRDAIKGFSLLVGVFLSDCTTADSGNFTVFPGGHRKLEQLFRSDDASKVLHRNANGRIVLPDVSLGEQHQVLAAPGDIVLCHHQLPHRAAPNLSPHIRYAVFFRVYHIHLPYEHAHNCTLRTLALQSLWSVGWEGMRHLIPPTELCNVDVLQRCDCHERATTMGMPTAVDRWILTPNAGFDELVSSPYADCWLRGCGCSSTYDYWQRVRRPIATAIHTDGDLLDIGCGSGFLLYCLANWSQHKITPHGFDNKEIVAKARFLFPALAANFMHTDLATWLRTPGRPYDFIYFHVWDACTMETPEQMGWIAFLLARLRGLNSRLIVGLYHPQAPYNELRFKRLEDAGYAIHLIPSEPAVPHRFCWLAPRAEHVTHDASTPRP